MGGGGNVACQILETAPSYVTVSRNMTLSPFSYQKKPWRMSLMIVSPMWHVEFKNCTCPLLLRGPCHLSNLRNGRNSCVALSILGVQSRQMLTSVSTSIVKYTSSDWLQSAIPEKHYLNYIFKCYYITSIINFICYYIFIFVTIVEFYEIVIFVQPQKYSGVGEYVLD